MRFTQLLVSTLAAASASSALAFGRPATAFSSFFGGSHGGPPASVSSSHGGPPAGVSSSHGGPPAGISAGGRPGGVSSYGGPPAAAAAASAGRPGFVFPIPVAKHNISIPTFNMTTNGSFPFNFSSISSSHSGHSSFWDSARRSVVAPKRHFFSGFGGGKPSGAHGGGRMNFTTVHPKPKWNDKRAFFPFGGKPSPAGKPFGPAGNSTRPGSAKPTGGFTKPSHTYKGIPVGWFA